MVKGVLVGFGIMIVLALIPIVHFAGIPFGPFIGGYYGVSAARDSTSSPGRKALAFGGWTGVLMGGVLVISGVIVTAVTGVSPILIWLLVCVATFYYASMAGLGAWYGELKVRG